MQLTFAENFELDVEKLCELIKLFYDLKLERAELYTTKPNRFNPFQLNIELIRVKNYVSVRLSSPSGDNTVSVIECELNNIKSLANKIRAILELHNESWRCKFVN